MRFKLIKKVSSPVNCYGVGEFATGDVIDIPAHLVSKAKANPSYELVTEAPEPVAPPAVKKAKNAK